MTIMFENTPAFKFIISNNGNKWLKNQQHPQRQPQQIIVPSNPKTFLKNQSRNKKLISSFRIVTLKKIYLFLDFVISVDSFFLFKMG